MALVLPLDFNDGLIELQTLTSQTANFTFTNDELTQALTFAWADSAVIAPAWDGSTQFQPGVYTYSIPPTVTAIADLYFQRSTSDAPERISPDLYEITSNGIQFLEWSQDWLDDNTTLFIKGRYKLQTTDNIPDQATANYVLYRAAERLLNQLLLKKTFVFLTNDTTVAEITAALKLFSEYVTQYQAKVFRQWESS